MIPMEDVKYSYNKYAVPASQKGMLKQFTPSVYGNLVTVRYKLELRWKFASMICGGVEWSEVHWILIK